MATYLLTWNPDKWRWTDLEACVSQAKKRGYFDTEWSCGQSKMIAKGDRVFILRQGVEPRGIFGAGHATSGVFERRHWDEKKAAEGRKARSIKVRFDTLLNPEAEAILPREWLGRGALAAMHWNTQMSGVLIPPDVAAALEQEWKSFLSTMGRTRFRGWGDMPDDEDVVQESSEIEREGRKRIFGHIPGYPEGSLFESRAELSKAGVHRPTQAGIAGSATEGADSIVLLGGYEDDQDLGDVIIYTGHGGREQATGKQVADQTLTAQNLALARNRPLGLPVRVIRGGRHRSPHTPPNGYRYDGLYRVEDYWHETGRSGFRVWRFRLVKIRDEQEAEASEPLQMPLGDGRSPGQPQRRETTVLRIVRDTRKAKAIRLLYDFTCQMCGVRLEGSAGPYAEAAHIRPLGSPHNGPDSSDNLLCLCPNHHVLFDMGGVTIAEDLSLNGMPGRLNLHASHRLNGKHLKYHRDHYTPESS